MSGKGEQNLKPPPEVLVLGAEGSGKSLLIRCIKDILKNDVASQALPSEGTMPTVGVEISTIDIQRKVYKAPFVSKSSGITHNTSAINDEVLRNDIDKLAATKDRGYFTLTVREIGSALSVRWSSYLPECRLLIFVIDLSDYGNIGTSLTLLHEILINEHALDGKSVLLALNKLDVVDGATYRISVNALGIQELQREVNYYNSSYFESYLCGGKEVEHCCSNIKIDVVQGSCISGTLGAAVLNWMEGKVSTGDNAF